MSDEVKGLTASQASAPTEPAKMGDGDAMAALLAFVMGGVIGWRWALRLASRRGWARGWQIAVGILAANVGLLLGCLWAGVLFGLGVPALFNAAATVLVALWLWRSTKANDAADDGLHSGVFPEAEKAEPSVVLRHAAPAKPAPYQAPAAYVVPESAFAMPTKVRFTYLDAEGNLTVRRVRVIWHGDYSFEAYCYMRRAERTFRYDRIVGDVVDTETGEILAVEAWRP